jgi:hypothetical protein
LPGLFDHPADRVTLAKTNQAFIEAYMVGLNHEFARELLWREYPSDQRGSYFRQFWEPTGAAPTPDIEPIHGWDASPLGTHGARVGAGDELVLVVRGEALRRYPGTLVYAQRAAVSSGVLGLAADEQQRRPVFTARIAPDVALFGFALTEAEARGDLAPRGSRAGSSCSRSSPAIRASGSTRARAPRRAPGMIWRGSTWSARPPR